MLRTIGVAFMYYKVNDSTIILITINVSELRMFLKM